MDAAGRKLGAALLGLVPTVGLAAANGGYFPSSWGWTAVGFLLVALGAAAVRERLALGSAELLLPGALLGLAVWAAVSSLWSDGATLPALEAQRCLVYAAATAAVLLAVRHAEALALLAGVAVGVTCVAGYALTQRTAGEQLADPVGYWNALGALVAIGLLLVAGFALDGGRLVRAAAGAAGVVLAVALYLTYSRGSWIALAAGVLVAGALLAPRRLRLAIAAAAAAVIVALAVGGGFERATAAFRAPLQQQEGDLSGRLVSLSGNGRGDYWRVAWRQVRDEPLLGTGAGTFERRWLKERTTDFHARDAHNLYLETLGELGPAGLAILLAALGVPAVAAFRAPRRYAFAGGAYAAFLVHASVDWDWEVPAVTVPALLVGAALVRARPQAERVPTRSMRAALLSGALALAAAAFAGQVAASALSRSAEALERGDAATAEAQARRARAWAPWSSQPWQRLGEAALLRGDEKAARQRFGEALDRDPGDWELWAGLASAGVAGAKSEARRLNPRQISP